jgi:aldehyde dehydrogenase (NAD+)
MFRCLRYILTSIFLPVLTPSPASVKDIDIAVSAAREALKTTWGKNVTGFERSKLLHKLADLIERDAQELAELEALNNGKPVRIARSVSMQM